MNREAVYTLWTIFILHVFIAFVTLLFLIIINLSTYPISIWFHKPLLVWSFILVLHYYFNKLLISGALWQFKDILINKLNQNARGQK